MASTFNRFNNFMIDVAAGVHANALNANTDTLKAYLSNATPDAVNDLVKADLAEITAEHGYSSGGHDTQNAKSVANGVISVVGTDIVITASGGTIGPFRYVVIYNDTPTSPADPLIGWYDYGVGGITLQDTEQFTIDFGAAIFTVG